MTHSMAGQHTAPCSLNHTVDILVAPRVDEANKQVEQVDRSIWAGIESRHKCHARVFSPTHKILGYRLASGVWRAAEPGVVGVVGAFLNFLVASGRCGKWGRGASSRVVEEGAQHICAAVAATATPAQCEWRHWHSAVCLQLFSCNIVQHFSTETVLGGGCPGPQLLATGRAQSSPPGAGGRHPP